MKFELLGRIAPELESCVPLEMKDVAVEKRVSLNTKRRKAGGMVQTLKSKSLLLLCMQQNIVE